MPPRAPARSFALMRFPNRLLVPLVLIAPALLPAVAAAGTEVTYGVKYSGAGTYHQVDRWESGDAWGEAETELGFAFSGEIADGVVFRDGDLVELSGQDLSDAAASGTQVWRGSGGAGETCRTVDGADDAHGWMRFQDALGDLVSLDGEEHVFLRPFDSWIVALECGASTSGVRLTNDTDMTEEGVVAAGRHTFDLAFSLPRDILGMGYIEQLVGPKRLTGADCPGFLEGETTECVMEWSGKVELRKLSERTTGAPAPAPAPTPAPTPVAEEEDWLVPLVPAKGATVSKDGKTAAVKVTCASGCAGEIALIPLTGGKAGRAGAAPKRGPKALAKKRFTLAAAPGARTIKLKLPAKARKALKKAKKAKLKITFTEPQRSVKTLTVKLPRR